MRSHTLRPWWLAVAACALGVWLLPGLRVSWVGPTASAEPGAAPDVSKLSPEEVYARAAIVAGPSVVNIDTEQKVLVRGFFEDFYRRVPGSGSGVIVSADGDIITNEHVVANADKIAVTLPNGKQYTGRVIGTDHSTDVAVVRIAATGLPAAKLGTATNLIPGQLAVAIGNPLGLRFTVTHGIVSATGRPVKIRDRVYENLIQTDCAINPGNSGGALVDRQGRVIGINTLVAEQANGVGFAIPVDTALRIAEQLKRYGKIKRPWTGIYAVALTPDVQRYLGLGTSDGALVQGVVPGSPADQTGIQPGDIITEIDGQRVRSDDDVRHITGRLKIGQKVNMVILRGDQRARGEVVIGESP